MTAFWKNWLKLWCIFVAGFGAVLASGGLPAFDGLTLRILGLVGGEPEFFAAQPTRFATALMGAVTLGWGLTILGLLDAIEAAGASAWRRLTAAVLAWFVIDSALSVATGFPLNVVPNTGLLATFLVPVLASGALKSR